MILWILILFDILKLCWSASGSPSPVPNATPTPSISNTVYYSLVGFSQSFTVPAAVTSINVEAAGAAGGCSSPVLGGNGARVLATLSISSGTTCTVTVGGKGGTITGGYSGGGTGFGNGGGGGGLTILVCGSSTQIVAGGGGGCSFANRGGDAGENGFPGAGSFAGAGGTLNAAGGGGGSASNGAALAGGNSGTSGNAGGGGAGYFGGGGGSDPGSGGGGSCYGIPGALSMLYFAGENSGDGYMTVTYNYSPTVSPSLNPSVVPTRPPTSTGPTRSPTAPTFLPTVMPSLVPSLNPSVLPSVTPTLIPTLLPTVLPSVSPSAIPSTVPTVCPTLLPTVGPSVLPSVKPSVSPTICPSLTPTIQPTVVPTVVPTTITPTLLPTVMPSVVPSLNPSVLPSVTPTLIPTLLPSAIPSAIPVVSPTVQPSLIPTLCPSVAPSVSFIPTATPSLSTSVTFSSTGSPQYWTVPTNVTSISVDASGAAGGCSNGKLGGYGARVQATVMVTPGTTCVIKIGVKGAVPAGGYVGGGSGYGSGGGGGGLTMLSCDGAVGVIAGGGGGCSSTYNGGNAGQTGVAGSGNGAGGGATQSTGGSSGGSGSTVGTSLAGGNSASLGNCGGGGAGFFGGGGSSSIGSGGGGSSYAPVGSTYSAGYNPTNGYMTIIYTYLPTDGPTVVPSQLPSTSPSPLPSVTPSVVPTISPSVVPTVIPTLLPTVIPTLRPSVLPTVMPSVGPSVIPSIVPTVCPTLLPSVGPSVLPTVKPSVCPSLIPTLIPSVLPSAIPSISTSAPTTSFSNFNIAVFAGNGVTTSSGSGGPATSASLDNPYGIFENSMGDFYVVEYSGNCVRKIQGGSLIITPFAGVCGAAFASTGDGSAGTSANLNVPYSVWGNSMGVFYISEYDGNRVRSVNSNIISTYIGTGTSATTGDSGPSSSAAISRPAGMWVNSLGLLYVAGSGGNGVRRVDSGSIITTFAGASTTASFSGDGGAATSATFRTPENVFEDVSGNIIIADTYNFRVRSVAVGIVTTVVGTGATAFNGENIAGTAANLKYPVGLAYDAQYTRLFIAQFGNNRVSLWTVATSLLSTFAGTGNPAYGGDGGPATSAFVYQPCGMFVDSLAKIYITDSESNRIRVVFSVVPTSTPSTLPTIGPSVYPTLGPSQLPTVKPSVGPSVSPSLTPTVLPTVVPTTIAPTPGPSVLPTVGPSLLPSLVPTQMPSVGPTTRPSVCPSVAPTSLKPSVVPTISPSSSPSYTPVAAPTVFAITSFAGSGGSSGYTGDGGAASSAIFDQPSGVWQNSNGVLYVAEWGNYMIRSITNGILATVAGIGMSGSLGDSGPASSASFISPQYVYGLSAGTLLVSDCTANRIRRITTTGSIASFVGSGISGLPTDNNGDGGTSSAACLTCPIGVAADTNSNVYVADSGDFKIRKRLVGGIISTLAGTGVSGFTGDNNLASNAQIGSPTGVYVDSSGNVYFADGGLSTVRQILITSTIITTVAGTGAPGFNGDGLAATSSMFNGVCGLWANAGGTGFVGDYNNNRIRIISNNNVYTIAGTGAPSSSGTGNGGMATSATFNSLGYFNGDTTGKVYVPDLVSSEIRLLTSVSPSANPSLVPTIGPSALSTVGPSVLPSQLPSRGPSLTPSVLPSALPSISTSAPTTSFSNFNIAVFAGNGGTSPSGSYGPATSAAVGSPHGVFENSVGDFYVTEFNGNCVRKIQGTSFIITPFAGICGAVVNSAGDGGMSTAANVNHPYGIWGSSTGVVYLSEYDGHRVRSVTNNIISTFIGSGVGTTTGDSGPSSSASIATPAGMWVNSQGLFYIACSGSNSVRRVDSSNIITTIAGTTVNNFSGDGGAPTAATFHNPENVFGDSSGNIVIADTYNHRIRSIVAGIVATVVGTGTTTFNGENIAGTAAALNSPIGLAYDSQYSRMFIAQFGMNRVAVWTVATNLLSTFVGTGSPSSLGNGGAASSATINGPVGIFVDSLAKMYIADDFGGYIRVAFSVAPTSAPSAVPTVVPSVIPSVVPTRGPSVCPSVLPTIGPSFSPTAAPTNSFSNYNIFTFAGTGGTTSTGSGGPATAASFGNPYSIYQNAFGNFYVAELAWNCVRTIQGSTLIITAFAGVCGTSTASSGDNGRSTSAKLYQPYAAWGNTMGVMYVPEFMGHRVRAVSSNIITTIAGTGTGSTTGDNSPSSSATINGPAGIWVNSLGFLYIACYTSNSIRMVDSGSIISTIAGTGSYSFSGDGGAATSASLKLSANVFGDTAGGIIIADTFNHRVRSVVAGTITTVVGTGLTTYNNENIAGTAANLHTPIGLAYDSQYSRMFIAQFEMCRVAMWVMSTDTVLTFAGTGSLSTSGDGGTASAAGVNGPVGIFVDSLAKVYIAEDSGGRIRMAYSVDPTSAPTVSSIPTVLPSIVPTKPTILPTAIPTCLPSTIYPTTPPVVSPVSFMVKAFAGVSSSVGSSVDGVATSGGLYDPYGVWQSSLGAVYIADYGNDKIRMVDSLGIMSSVAGTTNSGSSGGNGGPASSALFKTVISVWGNTVGTIYVADFDDYTVRSISPSGIISAFAGTGVFSPSTTLNGDGGPATSATFRGVLCASGDSVGQLYISDSTSYRIRRVTGGIIATVAGNGVNLYSGDGPATAISIGNPRSLFADSVGNFYSVDSNRIRKTTSSLILSTIAGTGNGAFTGDGQAATSSNFYIPGGIWCNTVADVFIGDTINYRIRLVTSGIVYTVAGNGGSISSGNDGPATSASVSFMYGVWGNSLGNLYFSEFSYNNVRQLLNLMPTVSPTYMPTVCPSCKPSILPSVTPSFSFTFAPSLIPSTSPSIKPSMIPTLFPSMIPSLTPSVLPTALPSVCPTMIPTTVPSYSFAPTSSYINFNIAVLAGNGGSSSTGSDGFATAASLGSPYGIFENSVGNFYVSELNSNCVRVILGSTLIISTFAGVCGTTAVSTGDSGAGTAAYLNKPFATWGSSTGLMYVAEYNGNKVRLLNGNIISTVAGTGASSNLGDGGPASAATLYMPSGMWVDSQGWLYVACYAGHNVRKVDSSAIVTTFAGTTTRSFSGDSGPATSATFTQPEGVFGNTAGSILIADSYNHRVRLVLAGTISTLMGTGVSTYNGENLAGTSINLNAPIGLALDSQNSRLFVAQYSNNRISMLTVATNIVSTFAGSGTPVSSGNGGAATAAGINAPMGIFADSLAKVYIAEMTGGFVRVVYEPNPTSAPTLPPTCLPSQGPSVLPTCISTSVPTTSPTSTPVASPVNFMVKAFAGTSSSSSSLSSSIDGVATSGGFYHPYGVWQSPVGNVYIAEYSGHKIRVVDPSGILSTIAGSSIASNTGNGGPSSSAAFSGPCGIWGDSQGTIYIADYDDSTLRSISAAAIVSAFAGVGSFSASGSDANGDGGPATSATFHGVMLISGDTMGTLYVADNLNNKIRKLFGGIVSTVAGTGINGFSDGGPATSNSIGRPRAVVTDTSGNFFFAELNHRIRKVTATTLLMSTAVGDGVNRFNGDGLPATSTSVSYPFGLWFSSSSDLYFSAGDLTRLRLLSFGSVYTVAGNGVSSSTGNDASATSASVVPLSVWGNTVGNLYFSEFAYNNVRQLLNLIPTISPTCLPSMVPTLSPSSIPSLLPSLTPSVLPSIVPTITPTIGPTYSPVAAPVVYSIDTVVGTAFSSGSTLGVGTSSKLIYPIGVWQDSTGVMYICGYGDNRLLSVATNFQVAVYAGCDDLTATSDGRSATNTYIRTPLAVWGNTLGQVYVSERTGYKVRAISVVGIVSTLLGTGSSSSSGTGDGGPASSAAIARITSISGDSNGNIYVVDIDSYRVRKISSGIVSLIAGNGVSGDGGDGGSATASTLFLPSSIVVTTLGTFYIATSYYIRVISASGIITRYAGIGSEMFNGDGLAATSSNFYATHLGRDSGGRLIFTEFMYNRVRMVDGGYMYTIAGTGTSGCTGDKGSATAAQIVANYIFVDSKDLAYFSDSSNAVIRKLSGSFTTAPVSAPTVIPTVSMCPTRFPSVIPSIKPSASPSTSKNPTCIPTMPPTIFGVRGASVYSISGVVGTGVPGSTLGTGTAAQLAYPYGVWQDVNGVTYICNYVNHRLLKVGTDLVVTVFAGTGSAGVSGDGGAASSATLNNPAAVWGNTVGQLFVSETTKFCIRSISTSSIISTVVGTGVAVTASTDSSGDGGPATSAQITNVYGICGDSVGNVYISDQTNNKVRKVASSGIISLAAGTGSVGFTGDGGVATMASLNNLYGIYCDSAGMIYISAAYRIRKVSLSNIIFTIIGTGSSSYNGDSLPATSTSISSISTLWGDVNGVLFVADYYNNLIRMVDASNTMAVIAGNGGAGTSGNDGPATSASLTPNYIFVTSSGSIYFTDQSVSVLRKLTFVSSPAPSMAPSMVPTVVPSLRPSCLPTIIPSTVPSVCPSLLPSRTPSVGPSVTPTITPSVLPTVMPSLLPTVKPTNDPTCAPSFMPTINPSVKPSCSPSLTPTFTLTTTKPTINPSVSPSVPPTRLPSVQPSSEPSVGPSVLPSLNTGSSSNNPTIITTTAPSRVPTIIPTALPALLPTESPSCLPSISPLCIPTPIPSMAPTTLVVSSTLPSVVPTLSPSPRSSLNPTLSPSQEPSDHPALGPSDAPILTPSEVPSEGPSIFPSFAPSIEPSEPPTYNPSTCPTLAPTAGPTQTPSVGPSGAPTVLPTPEPSMLPSMLPTRAPSILPSVLPSTSPSQLPSQSPSCDPSCSPSVSPTILPTLLPSVLPSVSPSGNPSLLPSVNPSLMPTAAPSMDPTILPSVGPSIQPSLLPTAAPTMPPSLTPTVSPSAVPSVNPSIKPSLIQTLHPSLSPSADPPVAPSLRPSELPSIAPTARPTKCPTFSPTVQPSVFSSVLSPTVVPTESPTVSQKDLWLTSLQSNLIAIANEAPSSISHQSNYVELYVKEVGPANVYGSSDTWIAELSGDLTVFSYTDKPYAIQLTSQTSLSQSATSRSCSESTKVLTLVSALISTTAVDVSVSCDDALWKVKTCTGSNAICAGCSDPCSSQTHCTGSESFNAYVLAPSETESCNTSKESQLRVLTVSFTSLQKPPSFSIAGLDVSKTSIAVTLKLSAGGTAYCGVFADSLGYTPSSVDEIVLQNFAAPTNPSTNVSVVTLTGLSAKTGYTLYCATASSLGVKMGLSQVLSSAVQVSTACCKTVTVSLTSSTTQENVGITNLVQASLNTLPSGNLQIAVLCTSYATGQVVSRSLYPASFTVSNVQPSSSFQSSSYGLTAGVYSMSLQLTGSSASEYEVVYASRYLTVLSVDTPLPAPVLTSAVFSNDGSYFTLKFDSSTNKAGTATSFNCDRLFSFDCASISKCQWVDAGTVTAVGGNFNNSLSCFVPGSRVSVTPNSGLKAQCSVSDCHTWSNASSSVSVRIQSPASAVTPYVAISAPSVVSFCGTIVLDASASTGSGGREWKNFSVVAYTLDNANISVLQQYIDNHYKISPPTAIPSSYLRLGIVYNFVITVCNFLDKCGQGSVRGIVLGSKPPSIILPGSALRSMTRSSPLLISSLASVTSCGVVPTVSDLRLQYSWSVATGGSVIVSLTTKSNDPSKLLLPSYSLVTNVMYVVTLTVTSKDLIATSSPVSVFVTQGPVVALVSGGSSFTVREGEVLVLDGSTSYDDDVQGVTGFAAGLSFAWSCVQTVPEYSDSCTSLFSGLFADLETVSLLAKNAAGGVGSVTLTVFDSSLTRSAQTIASVTIISSLSATLGLTSNRISGVMNAGQVLQLYAFVDLPADTAGNVTWSVDDVSAFNLPSAAQSAVTVALPSGPANVSHQVFMAFQPNSLPVGLTLTFSLTCFVSSSSQSVVSLALMINAPPQPGDFYVSPASGYALNESFTFVASKWSDANLPIQYQFGVLSAQNAFTSLVSPTERTFASILLSAGLAAVNYQVQCQVRVFDSLGANSSASYSVAVKPHPVMPASALSQFINSTLYKLSGSSDGIKQAVALTSNLLNEVDCSLLVQDCSTLNRQLCSKTPNTCGPCVSDQFVGESGDANSMCVDVSEIELSSAHSSCSSSSECHNSFASCISGRCTIASKQCPFDCSGHGVCGFVNIYTNETITNCTVQDSFCEAVCSCDPEYSLSDACDTTNDDLVVKMFARTMVLDSISTLSRLDNPTEQTVTGLVGSLNVATQKTDELSSEAVDSAFDTVTDILEGVESLGIDSNAASEVLTAIDSLGSTSSVVKGLNRRRLSADDALSGFDRIQSSLQKYNALIAGKLLPGLNAVSSTANNFRVSVQIIEGGSTVTVPRTPFEKAQNTGVSSVLMPLGSSSTAVSVISFQTPLYGGSGDSSSFLSNPLTVDLAGPVCAAPPCKVHIVLQNTQSVPLSLLNHHVPEYFNTTCHKGVHQALNHTCSNGQVVHNITCNGTSEYTIHTRCPYITYSQVCNSLSGSYALVDSSGCEFVSQSETNVTCSCPIGSSAASGTHRLLSSSNDSDYSASYVAMLSSTVGTFVSTFESADNLNAASLEKGWEVLVTIGVFAGVIIAALFLSNNADKRTVAAKDVKKKMKKSLKVFGKSLTVAPLSKTTSVSRKLKNQGVSDSEAGLVEQSLPMVLSASISLSQRIMQEIKLRHRWLGVIFYFSDSFPRAVRVASLATNVIVMLFIQSITYNITNPDDGSCEALRDHDSCVAPRSAFATGESKCQWNDVTDKCSFIQPSGSIKIVLFVAIFSAIISTPIALAADFIMQHIICAPIKKPVRTTQVISGSNSLEIRAAEGTDALAATRSTAVPSARNTKKRQVTTAQFQIELTNLANEIREYRDSLSAQQRIEFDLLWCLDENGNFKSSKAKSYWRFGSSIVNENTENVHQAVLKDLKAVDDQVNAEVLRFPVEGLEESQPPEKQRKFRRDLSKRLLFLFQCDLLPGVSGQILQSKGSRDNVSVSPVSRSMNIAGCCALAALNIGMLFYILLFALRQTSHRQSAWFQSFVLWLIVEILFVSTAIVMVTHILIPMVSMKDVTKIKQRLLDSLRDFHNGIGKKRSEVHSFNAAKYLFVSTRLAEKYPSLKAAAIISQFSTPWPKKSYQHFTDVTKSYSKKYTAISRSLSILLVFFLTNLLNVPASLQDMIIHMVTTATIGYTILLHIELFRIFPVLAFGPFLALCVIVHFIIQSGKANAKKRLAQLLPVSVNNTAGLNEKQESKTGEHEPNNTGVASIQVHLNRRQSVVKGLQVAQELVSAVRDPESGADEDVESSFEMSSMDSDDLAHIMKEFEEDGSLIGSDSGDSKLDVDEDLDSLDGEEGEMEEDELPLKLEDWSQHSSVKSYYTLSSEDEE